jgi:hypothetical protein
MKLWLGFSLWATLCLCVCAGAIIGIMVSGWKASVRSTWTQASRQAHTNMEQALNASLGFVRFASTSVPYIVPILPPANLSGFDPAQLMRMFDAYDGESGFSFGSFGMLMRHPAGAGKLSWQIAKGFGCSPYMYAYSDAAIHPQFHGHCIDANGTVDWAVRTYSGLDWGLKPQESALLAGSMPAVFLPIFQLLGQFTLTYEHAIPSAGVVGFAELDLRTFSDYIAHNVSIFSGKGYAYVTESATGAMIASTIPNSVVYANGTRIVASTSAVDAIRETVDAAATSTSIGRWLVTQTRHTEPGLDWMLYVVVLDADVYGDLYYSVIVAGVISMIIVLVAVAATFVGTFAWMTRPLRAVLDKLQQEDSHGLPYTPFTDFVKEK